MLVRSRPARPAALGKGMRTYIVGHRYRSGRGRGFNVKSWSSLLLTSRWKAASILASSVWGSTTYCPGGTIPQSVTSTVMGCPVWYQRPCSSGVPNGQGGCGLQPSVTTGPLYGLSGKRGSPSCRLKSDGACRAALGGLGVATGGVWGQATQRRGCCQHKRQAMQARLFNPTAPALPETRISPIGCGVAPLVRCSCVSLSVNAP